MSDLEQLIRDTFIGQAEHVTAHRPNQLARTVLRRNNRHRRVQIGAAAGASVVAITAVVVVTDRPRADQVSTAPQSGSSSNPSTQALAEAPQSPSAAAATATDSSGHTVASLRPTPMATVADTDSASLTAGPPAETPTTAGSLQGPEALTSVAVATAVTGQPTWSVTEDTPRSHQCHGYTWQGEPEHWCRTFEVTSNPARMTGAGLTTAVAGITILVGSEPVAMPITGHLTVIGHPATTHQISGTCGNENLLALDAGTLSVEIHGNACGPGAAQLTAIAQGISGLPG